MSGRGQQLVFRRMVIGFCSSPSSDQGLSAAAQIAAHLGLELEGLFIEDEGLLGLAGLPFLQEIEAGSLTARPIDVRRIEREMHLAARARRQALEKAARQSRTRWRFSSVRGEIGAVVAHAAGAHDIMVVLEPAGAAERNTGTASHMRRAAIRSAASVLYVPAIAHTQHGTIVAVVRGPEDRAVLDQAAALAARSGERLLVLSAAAGGNGLDIAGICAAHGVADNRVEVRAMRDASPRALGEELRRVPQSLIILARGVLGLDDEKALLQLAAVLRTPVLALESSSPNAVAGDTTDG